MKSKLDTTTPLKLKPEVKTEWLNALRSGEYEQGTGSLCKDGKYCCLGVLCELASKQGVCKKLEGIFSHILYDGNDLHLPASVKEWCGFGSNPQGCNAYVNGRYLTTMNDIEKKSFTEIADLIEVGL